MPSATQSRLHTHIVPAETAGGRVDAWLAARTGLSRVRIQALIAAGHVTCDNAPLSNASSRARVGMCLVVTEPPPAVTETLPQDIPLQVLYEDSSLLVLDKPAGLVVHPAPGHADGTLVNALLHHCDDLAGIGGKQRPGIVHRLDRDTSGVMVVAKTEAAMQGLVAQFQRGTIHKTYQALVHGIPRPSATRIETLIGRCPHDRKRMAVVQKGGRVAISRYRVTEVLEKAKAADVDRDGDVDICTKPWDGDEHVYLRNMLRENSSK